MILEKADWPQWLKDADTLNAIVERDEFGRIIWCGGEWCGGEWYDGVWRGGEWRDGVWRGGVWRGGKHWKYYTMLIKADMQGKMDLMPNEVPALKAAILAGKINGSLYEGLCACFCGTLANACDLKYNQLPIQAEADSPVEKFFLSMNPGDTPENSVWSKLAMEIIEDWESKRPTAAKE